MSARKEIDAVFRRGRYHRLGILHAKTLRASGPQARLLISVKKAVGSAPQRNRIKRLVREAFRHERGGLAEPHDICLFLTARPPWPLHQAVITAELRRLIERLNASPH